LKPNAVGDPGTCREAGLSFKGEVTGSWGGATNFTGKATGGWTGTGTGTGTDAGSGKASGAGEDTSEGEFATIDAPQDLQNFAPGL